VADHLNAVVSAKGDGEGAVSKGDNGAGTPKVSIAAIVGGMSAQKQRRLIERGVDILIATPGRLWDLLGEVCALPSKGDNLHVAMLTCVWVLQDDDLASQIRCLRFLVLDEADRMIEAGHFQELENIVKLTLRGKTSYVLLPPL
jgi:ATP-dependent RNA helicase DDX24/MAK5